MKKIDEDKKQIVDTALNLGFSGKSFLVTGATGMIGRIFVDSLKEITAENNIFVIGMNQEECERIFGSDTKMEFMSFETLDCVDRKIDYVIHLASPTNSKFLHDNPVETISFIYESTKKVLEFAKNHDSKVLYISSMEVFGEIYDETKKDENSLGYLKLNNTRNSYPESKRLCELLAYSYFKEFRIKTFSVRLAQTFGAGTSKEDPRIFGYFGRCVLNNENIVLNTEGNSFGNYCYISDTICAFFYVLSKGKPGETYNVVGDDCRSTILNMADVVCKHISKNNIQFSITIQDGTIYPNPTKLFMDNSKLKSIGWIPKYNLLDMYNRMIESWKE